MVLRTVSIVLAALFLAACGGKDALSPADIEAQAFEELSAEIREVVADPVRAEEAVSQMKFLRQEYDLLRKVIEERRYRGRALNANYDTTREDFDAFIAENREQMRLSRERVTSAMQAFRGSMTDEEWQDIGDATSDAMADLIQSLQAI